MLARPSRSASHSASSASGQGSNCCRRQRPCPPAPVLDFPTVSIRRRRNLDWSGPWPRRSVRCRRRSGWPPHPRCCRSGRSSGNRSSTTRWWWTDGKHASAVRCSSMSVSGLRIGAVVPVVRDGDVTVFVKVGPQSVISKAVEVLVKTVAVRINTASQGSVGSRPWMSSQPSVMPSKSESLLTGDIGLGSRIGMEQHHQGCATRRQLRRWPRPPTLREGACSRAIGGFTSAVNHPKAHALPTSKASSKTRRLCTSSAPVMDRPS